MEEKIVYKTPVDRYTVKMEEVGDGSGDLMFQIPPEIVKEMNIRDGDTVDIVEENGYIVVKLIR